MSNADRCHLLVSTNNIRVENFDIKNNHCEKLLGVIFDHKLTFKSHTADLCKKSSKNVHALARLIPCMNMSKRCIIMNTFLNPNSVTALLYGCVTVVLSSVKSIDYTNVACV